MEEGKKKFSLYRGTLFQTRLHYVLEVSTFGPIWKLYLFSTIHLLINVSREERQNIYTLQRHIISDKNIMEVPTFSVRFEIYVRFLIGGSRPILDELRGVWTISTNLGGG